MIHNGITKVFVKPALAMNGEEAQGVVSIHDVPDPVLGLIFSLLTTNQLFGVMVSETTKS